MGSTSSTIPDYEHIIITTICVFTGWLRITALTDDLVCLSITCFTGPKWAAQLHSLRGNIRINFYFLLSNDYKNSDGFDLCEASSQGHTPRD